MINVVICSKLLAPTLLETCFCDKWCVALCMQDKPSKTKLAILPSHGPAVFYCCFFCRRLHHTRCSDRTSTFKHSFVGQRLLREGRCHPLLRKHGQVSTVANFPRTTMARAEKCHADPPAVHQKTQYYEWSAAEGLCRR